MKEQLIQLLLQIGLFFANCDGDYDSREKKFINNFLRSFEVNHVLEPGTYDKKALEDDVVESFDTIMANMTRFVNGLDETEKEAFIKMIDSYIQGIIKADEAIDEHEIYYYNTWKQNFKS